MIRHAFRLIWNRKRRSLLLMGEVLLSFVVVFAVTAAIITGAIRYRRPLGFSYDHVWVLHIDRGVGMHDEAQPGHEDRETLSRIRDELESEPDVKGVSYTSGNFPYSQSLWTTGFNWDGKMHSAWIWLADDRFADVMGLTLLEGRWFNAEDDAAVRDVIVVTRQMKEEVFGGESPVGKIQIKDDQDERLIVGVVDDYRYRGEFEPHRGGFFLRSHVKDTGAYLPNLALFSVRDGSDARVEERILQRVRALAPNWTFRIETLVDKRAAHIKDNLLGAGVFVAVAGFLIVNVALGLFGVLWQSISRRHGEIGLRRAVGARPGSIAGQVLLETLVLATIALLGGILVAAQIPILGLDSLVIQRGTVIPGSTYVLAMVCGVVMIYLLVSLCALYPSQLAARVEPASALHDE